MRRLGIVLVHVMMASSLVFCKGGDNSQAKEEVKTETGSVEKSETTAEGKADITLTAGGEQYKITGPCGWATAMGENYIGANDASNNLKTFAAFFNIKALPDKTTTYTLVDDNSGGDPTQIKLNITELKGNKLFEYRSVNSSGKLTLVVSGDKVTVDLTGITLKPSTEENPIFPSLNTGAFSKTGTLSGTLEFYKASN